MFFFPIESEIGCKGDRQRDRAHAREKAQSFENKSVLSAWKAEHGGKNGLLHPRLGDKLRKKTFAELVDMDIAQL